MLSIVPLCNSLVHAPFPTQPVCLAPAASVLVSSWSAAGSWPLKTSELQVVIHQIPVDIHPSMAPANHQLYKCHGFVPSGHFPYPVNGPIRMFKGGAEVPQSRGAGSRRKEPGLKKPERVRSEFPETWLWSDTSIGYSW